MNNTMQLYIDDNNEVKGYPITTPDRVIDENGVSVKKRLKNNVKFDIVGKGEGIPGIDKGYDDTEIKKQINDINEKMVDTAKKLGRVIYPSYFGAKGDGINDDTDSIISMFEFSKLHGLNVSFENNKTYKINKRIKITHPVEINGSNCLIDYFSSAKAERCFHILKTHDVTIKNFRFKSVANQSPSLDVDNNTQIIGLASNVNCILVEDCQRVVVENIYGEEINGIGIWGSTDIFVKNYNVRNCAMPIFLGNNTNINIDGFYIEDSTLELSGFYHPIYLNGVITNVNILNGTIKNVEEHVKNDAINFLVSSPKENQPLMENINVSNITIQGNYKECIRYGHCKDCNFNEIIFKNKFGEVIIETIGKSENVKINNSDFYLGNAAQVIYNTALATKSYVEITNSKIKIKLQENKDKIFYSIINLRMKNTEFEVIEFTKELLTITEGHSTLPQTIIFDNVNLITEKTYVTRLATGNYNKNTQGTIRFINNLFDVYNSHNYLCYAEGVELVNNVLFKGKNFIDISNARNISINNNVMNSL